MTTLTCFRSSNKHRLALKARWLQSLAIVTAIVVATTTFRGLKGSRLQSEFDFFENASESQDLRRRLIKPLLWQLRKISNLRHRHRYICLSQIWWFYYANFLKVSIYSDFCLLGHNHYQIDCSWMMLHWLKTYNPYGNMSLVLTQTPRKISTA